MAPSCAQDVDLFLDFLIMVPTFSALPSFAKAFFVVFTQHLPFRAQLAPLCAMRSGE
jgi:hypothetical protein